MSSIFIIINGEAIYDTIEEARNNIKYQIIKDYPKYGKHNYEYNIYQSYINNRWYIETRISKKINVINKEFIIEI